MIEYVTKQSADFMTEARRRAAAGWRRAQAAKASTDWPEFAPPVALSSGPLGAAQSADREIGRQTAVRARAVAAFAASRPASVDRAPGERGAMSAERWAARPEVLRAVSEWATPELVVALSLSEQAAEALLTQSLTLVGRLPGTLAALEAGALHPGHLRCLLEHVAPIEKDSVRAEVEAGLLRWAAGRVITPAQLAARARREVAKRDARAATRNLEKAIRERGVFLQPGPVDGMSCVGVVCTLPEAQALYRTLQALVDVLEPDPQDGRTRGQKLVDVLLDLVLRPGESDRPPVQVLLTVVAAMGTLLGGDAPGEIDGHTVPAEMIRHLLRTLTGHRPADAAPDATAAAGGSAPAGEASPAPAGEAVPAPADATPADDPVPSDGVVPAGEALRRDWEIRWAPFDPEAADAADADLARDPDPEPVPEEVLLALWNGQDPDPIGVDDLLRPEDLLDPADWADLERWFDDGSAPDLVHPADPPAPPGRGWWASADRAVADAGQAVQRAVEALGHARRLVDTARVADVADETAWADSPAGRVSRAETAIEALAAAGEARRDWLAELLAQTGGGGLADRPRIALTDALTGTLLALTDLPGLRRAGHCGRPACRRRPHTCGHDLTGRAGIGPPPATDGYRPGAELDRYVRARDRRCRFPGCRRRVPKGGELDHHRPWPDGPTSAGNLTGFCTTNHRGKHQAPGWTYHLAPDGTLTVTTPTGLTTTTEPPPY
jgi:uncharacterized protein DUF222